MGIEEKLMYIESFKGFDILLRSNKHSANGTFGDGKWYVNLSYEVGDRFTDFPDKYCQKSIYKGCSDNLEELLDNAIILMLHKHEYTLEELRDLENNRGWIQTQAK